MGVSTPVLPRLLRLLDLLAARGTVPGPELAAAVGVDTRTLRRDVDRLRDLGHAVESVRGRNGGYRLARSRRLPPLVLDDQQAAAVVLGVDAVRRAGVDVGDVGALADRLVRLLPEDVAERVAAMRDALAPTPTSGPASDRVAAARLLDLGVAVRDGGAVRLRYVDRRGGSTDRRIDPWGVVEHRGRWYVVGHDHLRDGVRVFRVDRIGGILRDGVATVTAPDGFDARAHVEQQVTHDAWRHQVEVELHTDLDEARRRVPSAVGHVVAEGERVVLRVGADDLDGMARVLASLGLDLTVIAPVELRDALARLASRLAESAER